MRVKRGLLGESKGADHILLLGGCLCLQKRSVRQFRPLPCQSCSLRLSHRTLTPASAVFLSARSCDIARSFLSE